MPGEPSTSGCPWRRFPPRRCRPRVLGSLRRSVDRRASARAGLGSDLLELATDAAVRAWEMAVGLSADAGLGGAPADADLARKAARVPWHAFIQPDGRALWGSARAVVRQAHGGTTGW